MNKQSLKSLELKIRCLYPIWIIVSIFSIAYVPSLLFEKNDILSTAANVAEHQLLFRLSIVGSFATAILMVYVAYYLYLLFENVNSARAKLMLILALLSIPFIGFDVFKILAANSVDAEYIYNSLSITRNAQTIAEIFWGLWLFPLGMLVIESKYFPKFIGYLLIASCFGYLLAVIIKVVFPDLRQILVITDVLAFGELIFALWFVFKGVNPQDSST